MVVTCEIHFDDNPEAIFYAGQVITGKVTLTADKVKQVKAVTLRVNGCAKTRWTDEPNKSSDTTYQGQVDYMNTLTNLLDPKTTDQSVSIEPGIHAFTFAYHIPKTCPSSLESFNGSIRYFVQVTLQRPWKYDQTYTRPFTVLSIKDLNEDSCLLKLPVKSDTSKVFCCGPFKSQPLQINVQLPQTGYVAGQDIPITTLITNETKARISAMSFSLVMTVTLFSREPLKKSKTETRTLSKLTGDAVGAHCEKQFNYLLPIPATPPTCSRCSIITVCYHVAVEVKIQGLMLTNQYIQTPVTIGNVPFHNNSVKVVEEQPMRRPLNFENVISENNNDFPTCNGNVESFPAMDNKPAPEYKVATHMPLGSLIQDPTAYEYCEKYFSPKYPVFNMKSYASSPQQPCSGNEVVTDATRPVVSEPDKTTWL